MSSSVSINPVQTGFAGEVSDIDCRRPLSAEQISVIEAGMNQYAVLVFRQQAFADAEQVQFAQQFGELERSSYGTTRIHFRTEQEARPLGQDVVDFSNIDAAGKPLAEHSRAYQFKLADRLWHSDSSFKRIPAKYSMLSGRTLPSWGGNTEFADMRQAYDALDARMKSLVENLVCLHSQMYSREKVGFADLSPAEREAFKPVRQRLVRTHPVTGRRSLFLSSHAGVIEGMSVPDSRMLLLELTEFATQARFVYSHTWQLNDLVVWDNRTTLHRATRFDWNEPRDVRQVRLAGNAQTIEQLESQNA